MESRCQLCFGDIHKFSDCRVYMNMTHDQRKLALLIRDGCFKCTGSGHIGSKCPIKMNCQKCQRPEHHETICEASSDSWKAVVTKKWDKNPQTRAVQKKDENPTAKKTFLVQSQEEATKNNSEMTEAEPSAPVPTSSCN